MPGDKFKTHQFIRGPRASPPPNNPLRWVYVLRAWNLLGHFDAVVRSTMFLFVLLIRERAAFNASPRPVRASNK